jgi:Helix-turn-helix domain
MGDHNLDTLLTGREAAAILKLSVRTLERHRTAGTGPQFIRLGRAIRYSPRDLLDHTDRHAHRSTSEPGVASAAD